MLLLLRLLSAVGQRRLTLLRLLRLRLLRVLLILIGLLFPGQRTQHPAQTFLSLLLAILVIAAEQAT